MNASATTATPATRKRYAIDTAEVERAIRLLIPAGEVVEVRAPKAASAQDRRPHVIDGFFDSAETLARNLAYITEAEGIYFTLNQFDPAHLALAHNRLLDRPASTIADAHITRRRWLPIDLDPERPVKNVSATDAEHTLALARAHRIAEALQAEGWPAPILIDSGNGAWVLWAIDLPADDGGLVQHCLQALAARFDDAQVKVDLSVFNPARIGKIPGTWARKGDDTPERPHRQARLLAVPDQVQTVSRQQLEALAATRPQEPARPQRDARRTQPASDFDLEKWIGEHLPGAKGPRDWTTQAGKGRKWLIDCISNSDHTDGSAWVGELGNGAITAGCQHQSCTWTWEDLRAKFEPGHRERGADRRNGGSERSHTTPTRRQPAAQKAPTAAPAPSPATADYTGPAIWHNSDHDAPVEITGQAGPGPDGRIYMAVADSSTAIPLDELHLPPTSSADQPPAWLESEDYGDLPADVAQPTTRPVAEIAAELEALRPEGGDKAALRAVRDQIYAKALDLAPECANLSKVDLQRISITLRGLGLPGESVRNWVTAVNDAKRRQRADSGDTPDAVPYEVDEGRIYKINIQQTDAGPLIQRIVVADFTALITEEVTAEDGHRYYVIAGNTADGLPYQIEISAEKFTDDGALLAALDEAAGAYSPVRAKMTAHLRPAIKLLTRQAGQTRQTQRYDRTGWADGHFLIPGREPADTTIKLDPKLAYVIPATADLPQGLLALDHLLNALDRTCTTVALTSILQGPLAQPAGWDNERYNTFVAGRTGSLKTSVLQCGMSIWGEFMDDNRLIKWGEGATRYSIMHYATESNDLPLLLDNFKPNIGDGIKGFVALVHNLTEGSDKDRMQRSRDALRGAKEIHTWPIFTGEDVPADDPATIARLLVVHFDWDAAGDNEHLTAAQALAAHLPAVGAAWLEWLEGADGQRVAKLAGAALVPTRADWLRKLKAAEKDAVNAGRIASNLAINQLSFWALRQHPTIGPIVEKYAAEHTAGLAQIAEDMARRSKVAREATRFLKALSELIFTGRCALETKGQPLSSSILPERRIGWRDPQDGSYYLLFDVAKREVLKILGPEGLGSLSDDTLHKQLQDLGYIQTHDDGRHLKRVRLVPGANAQYCLHLTANAIGAPSNPLDIDGEYAEEDADGS